MPICICDASGDEELIGCDRSYLGCKLRDKCDSGLPKCPVIAGPYYLGGDFQNFFTPTKEEISKQILKLMKTYSFFYQAESGSDAPKYFLKEIRLAATDIFDAIEKFKSLYANDLFPIHLINECV